ncbi:glycoside hydrolase family 47 protein [Botryobasidium botryosum FD-172 SS1]|uniref:alpha-1,2-Mannosidase n=1 Tax=Botryobasidium botryosum (strain FD-172 SS1) TaxID=930990 RepID=A0A067M4A6_BOTB1|nr:glycoside hydrolase family 47 protein [Botryobasidium botryosum FD-172 SS1]
MLPTHLQPQAPATRPGFITGRWCTRVTCLSFFVIFVLVGLFSWPSDSSFDLPFRPTSPGRPAEEHIEHPHDDDRPPPFRPPPQKPPPKPAHGPFTAAKSWEARAEAVKQSFVHAYHSYEAGAFGADELKPLTNESVINFNGWGVTIIDSLDTMLLMGLTAEFDRGLAHVESLDILNYDSLAPFFETVIRYLGGLLSAYALSGEPILLQRADELGKSLLPVFGTASGLPRYGVNPKTGVKSTGSNALLAELGSCQMEYKYLAHLTKNKAYWDAMEKIVDLMKASQDKGQSAMWATYWNTDNGRQIVGHVTIGGLSDSAYEYVLKQYLMSGKTEKRLLKMYLDYMNEVLETMLFVSPTRHLLYVSDLLHGKPTHKLEHLSCFFPGLLALGVHSLSDDELPPKMRELHAWAAEGLATTCWLQYADSPTGLGPEDVRFDAWSDGKGELKGRWLDVVREWEKTGRKDGAFGVGGAPLGVKGGEPVIEANGEERDYRLLGTQYLLRPEVGTIESIYLMWLTTGDIKWRERGWGIYQAIETYTKAPYGYACVNDVEMVPPKRFDSMPSYFFAETLKYLYLLFQEDTHWSLDKYVFNTEAHPIPVFRWRQQEMEAFKIPAA